MIQMMQIDVLVIRLKVRVAKHRRRRLGNKVHKTEREHVNHKVRSNEEEVGEKEGERDCVQINTHATIRQFERKKDVFL